MQSPSMPLGIPGGEHFLEVDPEETVRGDSFLRLSYICPVVSCGGLCLLMSSGGRRKGPPAETQLRLEFRKEF